MADAGSAESQQKKIREIRQRFRAEYVQDSPDRYDPRHVDRLMEDDVLVDGYLEWRHYVIDDTLKMIDESLQWRKEFHLSDINESCVHKSLFESGVHYFHGYDKEGHKLFWFRVRLYVKDARMLQEKKRYVAFWLERYVRREPGAPITVVFDMSESGLGNVDLEFVKYIINCFQVYYPRLLSKMIMYEMPWIMNAAWRVIKGWLSPDAIDKLKFVSKSDIQTYVHPEHLPAYMGGTDSFKYSYPPLLDDDFQTAVSDPGHEEEMEMRDEERKVDEQDVKENLDMHTEPHTHTEPDTRTEPATHTEPDKKVYFAEDGVIDAARRVKAARRPSTTFKGTFLHISPAEELSFGSREGEKRCVIVLNNVTQTHVAYKVRTTAPQTYRVKPSSSVCEPETSVEIMVSLCGGSVPSAQDRFLIMAAEMEQSSCGAIADLAQFWKDIPKTKVMEHRLRCDFLEDVQPDLSPATKNDDTLETNSHQEMHTTLMQVLASSSRLEQKLDSCLWTQKVLLVLVTVLTAMSFFMLCTEDKALHCNWTGQSDGL